MKTLRGSIEKVRLVENIADKNSTRSIPDVEVYLVDAWPSVDDYPVPSLLNPVVAEVEVTNVATIIVTNTTLNAAFIFWPTLLHILIIM